jgi:hypothetical protein
LFSFLFPSLGFVRSLARATGPSAAVGPPLRGDPLSGAGAPVRYLRLCGAPAPARLVHCQAPAGATHLPPESPSGPNPSSLPGLARPLPGRFLFFANRRILTVLRPLVRCLSSWPVEELGVSARVSGLGRGLPRVERGGLGGPSVGGLLLGRSLLLAACRS